MKWLEKLLFWRWKKNAENEKNFKSLASKFEIKIEKDGSFEARTDFTGEEIAAWLVDMGDHIAESFKNFPEIKNYLTFDIEAHGLKVSMAVMKRGGKTPHEIRLELEERIKLLEIVIGLSKPKPCSQCLLFSSETCKTCSKSFKNHFYDGSVEPH